MTQFIQVLEIGRFARELNFYPVLPGRDAEALLSQELEHYWQQPETIIVPVQGECNSYAIKRKPSLIGGKQTIKVRVVEVGTADDTQIIEVAS